MAYDKHHRPAFYQGQVPAFVAAPLKSAWNVACAFITVSVLTHLELTRRSRRLFSPIAPSRLLDGGNDYRAHLQDGEDPLADAQPNTQILDCGLAHNLCPIVSGPRKLEGSEKLTEASVPPMSSCSSVERLTGPPPNAMRAVG